MPDISLIEVAHLLGSTKLSEMAEKVGLTFPPAPGHSISAREVATLASQPLEPTNLRLNFSGQSHPPDSRGVPVKDVLLTWQDPGAGSLRQATSWSFQVRKRLVNQVIERGVVNEPRAPLTTLEFATNYLWDVSPIKEIVGAGPSTPLFEFVTQSAPTPTPTPTPTPHPTPTPPPTATLTLQVKLGLPAQTQSITEAKWVITGPGAPAAAIDSPISGSTSQVAIPLPRPSGGSASYTIRSSVAFFFDGLVRLNGISGGENSQVDLSAPTPIPWTGQNRVALFSVTYDSFNNVFIMAFQGLLG